MYSPLLVGEKVRREIKASQPDVTETQGSVLGSSVNKLFVCTSEKPQPRFSLFFQCVLIVR